MARASWEKARGVLPQGWRSDFKMFKRAWKRLSAISFVVLIALVVPIILVTAPDALVFGLGFVIVVFLVMLFAPTNMLEAAVGGIFTKEVEGAHQVMVASRVELALKDLGLEYRYSDTKLSVRPEDPDKAYTYGLTGELRDVSVYYCISPWSKKRVVSIRVRARDGRNFDVTLLRSLCWAIDKRLQAK